MKEASPRVLITGAGGQLGKALIAAAPPGIRLKSVTHAELDIADPAAVEIVWREFAPDLVLNAAAFTAVDEAERLPEAARRANSRGPEVLAGACARAGARADACFHGLRVRRRASPAVRHARQS